MTKRLERQLRHKSAVQRLVTKLEDLVKMARKRHVYNVMTPRVIADQVEKSVPPQEKHIAKEAISVALRRKTVRGYLETCLLKMKGSGHEASLLATIPHLYPQLEINL